MTGRHLDSGATGDRAPSLVKCLEVVSPLQAFQQAIPHAKVLHSNSRSVEQAVDAAPESEVAIVMVGYDAGDEVDFMKPSREHDTGAFGVSHLWTIRPSQR